MSRNSYSSHLVLHIEQSGWETDERRPPTPPRTESRGQLTGSASVASSADTLANKSSFSFPSLPRASEKAVDQSHAHTIQQGEAPKRKFHHQFIYHPLHPHHPRGVLPPKLNPKQLSGSWFAAFVGIFTVAAIHYLAPALVAASVPGVVASFGATAVLVYGAVESPLAQPRCVIGGQVLSALVGVTVHKVVAAISRQWDVGSYPDHPNAVLQTFACALAVSLSILVMHVTRMTHPPGGATALVAVMGPAQIWDLGYLYVAAPILLGSVILTAVAVIANRGCGRWYPLYWWTPKKVKDVGVGVGTVQVGPMAVTDFKDLEAGRGNGGLESDLVVVEEQRGDDVREGDGGRDRDVEGDVVSVDDSTSMSLPSDVEEVPCIPPRTESMVQTTVPSASDASGLHVADRH
ncbi:hypothetical protein HDV00_003536 [Rhizophlyctis rosea]|nr:hypothetical protein HDV00_003536 [Rhizophlyctis rosea]